MRVVCFIAITPSMPTLKHTHAHKHFKIKIYPCPLLPQVLEPHLHRALPTAWQ